MTDLSRLAQMGVGLSIAAAIGAVALLLARAPEGDCPPSAPSEPMLFRATGSCGPPGTIEIKASPQASRCGLLVSDADATGLPARGTLGSEPLSRGGWKLSGESFEFELGDCAQGGAFATEGEPSSEPDGRPVHRDGPSRCWFLRRRLLRDCRVAAVEPGRLEARCVGAQSQTGGCTQELVPVGASESGAAPFR